MRNSLVILALAGLGGTVFAQQINDPNQITLRHDFESRPPSAPPTGPFVLDEVTYSEASTGSGGPGWRLISVFPAQFGRQLTDNAGISNITLSFSTAMAKVGLNVGIGPDSGTSTYEVRFFNGNTQVGMVSGSVNGVGGNFFAGWENGAGITRVNILESSGENGRVGGIDNVRYDVVPEPATMVALGAGLAALAARRRKA
ncbi:MAG: PEP-CTERM sorting domain-containing protein [Fimbriimonadaceae bacterium]|nr:PEP-CTERM sorting domain-containing protein [Fimbriimonadaceae bacterium]QYK56990.1 MAG: PEP-CTERM sorting domain-containing protein [Fimbriimonadaceae bacterium]